MNNKILGNIIKNQPKTIIFRPNEHGIWTRVTGDSETLSEYLLTLGIENLPNGVEFMRYRTEEHYIHIYVQAYAVKFTIYR